jgi:hypothetical protein
VRFLEPAYDTSKGAATVRERSYFKTEPRPSGSGAPEWRARSPAPLGAVQKVESRVPAPRNSLETINRTVPSQSHGVILSMGRRSAGTGFSRPPFPTCSVTLLIALGGSAFGAGLRLACPSPSPYPFRLLFAAAPRVYQTNLIPFSDTEIRSHRIDSQRVKPLIRILFRIIRPLILKLPYGMIAIERMRSWQSILSNVIHPRGHYMA